MFPAGNGGVGVPTEKLTELSAQDRQQAISSLQTYAEQNLAEPLNTLAAGLLLDFFLEEIGPLVYNRAVADAQQRMQHKLMDLEGELQADAFQYWPSRAARKRR
ncbi:DUF2164 domain-containing protein [Terriglobus albidus]|uniref:DUF2164 domain-containing protein n=1 Tax=Terriglobus albidus TaxID=1592106 RepID=A0A5B9E617_9BACT|nr:DUF2164 domain-containing protein [Terriglobus albidus]